MAAKWKVIVPVGVLALVAVIVIVARFGQKPPEVAGPAPTGGQPSATESPVEPAAKPPAATGNIDDAINALFTDSSNETAQTAKAMDDDVALVGLDSQAISDFGQSYNENDF